MAIDLNPLADPFYRDDPQAAFFSQLPSLQSPNMRQFYGGNYPRIRNEFMGQLAQNPQQEFTDFLGGFNWRDYYLNLPPMTRGFRPQRFVPSTRWLTF
tara:strand:+ start:254 stop:547 length:294 start_codon:yes stop_codon:yes gene_type:complete